ncbi:RNA helicase family protein [Striga asiatica]|uniref:RNA helicase family protein n=1 Tax=Striga asiatica TaxID=4170 RepID=A0A5A7P6H9_STRAF|nr:RNA helicase family protein [Striga asiatica]
MGIDRRRRFSLTQILVFERQEFSCCVGFLSSVGARSGLLGKLLTAGPSNEFPSASARRLTKIFLYTSVAQSETEGFFPPSLFFVGVVFFLQFTGINSAPSPYLGRYPSTVKMGDLNRWVSDKLMSLVGFSQPTMVHFIITLSKRASSPSEIVKQLAEFGVASSTETLMFAKEIFARVEHKTSGPNVYQQQEREAVMLARKQKTFKLLEAEDEDDDAVPVASLPRKEETRSKKFRKRSETQDEMDDEIVKNEGKERRVRSRTSRDDDDSSESEEERLRDQREREELERKIRERDAAGTRKVTYFCDLFMCRCFLSRQFASRLASINPF